MVKFLYIYIYVYMYIFANLLVALCYIHTVLPTYLPWREREKRQEEKGDFVYTSGCSHLCLFFYFGAMWCIRLSSVRFNGAGSTHNFTILTFVHFFSWEVCVEAGGPGPHSSAGSPPPEAPWRPAHIEESGLPHRALHSCSGPRRDSSHPPTSPLSAA